MASTATTAHLLAVEWPLEPAPAPGGRVRAIDALDWLFCSTAAAGS